MNQKKSASILKKFLLFNLLVFSVLGLFTFIYLQAIQPNLVNNKSENHLVVIKNTTDHLHRLKIDFNEKGLSTFLLSARFLFQSLDRVQFYNNLGEIIGDTNILDLDQSVFSKTDFITQEKIDGTESDKRKKLKKEQPKQSSQNKYLIKEIILKKFKGEPLVLESKVNNNFFISTLNQIKLKKQTVGYIIVTEEANDILFAVQERKNFIIRTVLAIALVILIFSLFLNKYILKPIGFLVLYTESIKAKADKPINVGKLFVREDEIGK